MKAVKTETHVRLELQGAGFAIPIEVIRGIKDGTIPPDKYSQAADFLSGETKASVSVEHIKSLCEGAV